MPNPWDHELVSAVPRLTVEPRQRVRVIQHLHDANRDPAFEVMAAKSANGRLKIYMSLVQWLFAHPNISLNAFDQRCRQADQAQTHLSEINARRDNILERLRTMKFVCPEVPETTESSRKCKCGSTDLLTTARQTRSADEGQTVFFICCECGTQFR